MPSESTIVLVVGALTLVSIVGHVGFRRLGLPPMVSYLLIGFGLRLADDRYGLLAGEGRTDLAFLAEVGVIALLFRVGLESDLTGLLGQLTRATGVWLGNFALSALLGYLVARHLIGLALVPSLFTAAALSATSVGVSVELWREAGALRSANGELLIDVAELDDISGVVCVALLLALAPILAGGGTDGLGQALRSAVGSLVGKAFLFGLACFLFSRYVERALTERFRVLSDGPDLMVFVASLGLIIAGVAGWLGFSTAIGAFFAGILFSRDPAAVREDGRFGIFAAFFVPFFFIGIGYEIEPSALGPGLRIGGLLIVAAVVGKVVGGALPAWPSTGRAGALLLGFSLVPRAEIALVIARQGRQAGPGLVPPTLYAALVATSAVTCFGAPLVVRWLLRRHPQESRELRPRTAVARTRRIDRPHGRG